MWANNSTLPFHVFGFHLFDFLNIIETNFYDLLPKGFWLIHLLKGSFMVSQEVNLIATTSFWHWDNIQKPFLLGLDQPTLILWQRQGWRSMFGLLQFSVCFLFVVRTFKMRFTLLTKFQVYNTILLHIATMLYIWLFLRIMIETQIQLRSELPIKKKNKQIHWKPDMSALPSQPPFIPLTKEYLS